MFLPLCWDLRQPLSADQGVLRQIFLVRSSWHWVEQCGPEKGCTDARETAEPHGCLVPVRDDPIAWAACVQVRSYSSQCIQTCCFTARPSPQDMEGWQWWRAREGDKDDFRMNWIKVRVRISCTNRQLHSRPNLTESNGKTVWTAWPFANNRLFRPLAALVFSNSRCPHIHLTGQSRTSWGAGLVALNTLEMPQRCAVVYSTESIVYKIQFIMYRDLYTATMTLQLLFVTAGSNELWCNSTHKCFSWCW